MLGISGNGFIKRTGTDTYTNDTTVYLTASTGITKSDQANNLAEKIWAGTSANYAALGTYYANTIYIITD